MNDTHDAWMQDSVQHQMNGQDPNAWLHERLAEPSSSSVTSTFDQQPFNVTTNGFDQHAAQQPSFFSTFHSDPINQHQRLPARPQLGHQEGSFDSSSSYPLATEPVANSNGPSTASINNSPYYTNPYQPSHTPSTFPYAQPHSPPAEAQRQNYQPPTTYAPWSPLSGATNTPPTPPANETHQQITIDPQLVTMSSQAQPSRGSVNPSYLQTQSHPYPPTTVTPSSLHNAITPTQYYSAPSVVPPPAPKKAQVQAHLQPSRPTSAQSTRSTSSSGSVSASSSRHPESHLRNLLSANAFESSPAGAARSLINALKTMGISDVSSSLRKEILNTMRDNAGKDFFEAWAKSADGMETFRIWLKSAVTRKDDGKREADETLMPLLNVIDRLPLGIEELRAAKIGKLVKSIVVDPPSSAAKDLASVLTQKWTKLINQEQKRTEEDGGSNPDSGKKRKATEAPAPKIPPAKKTSTTAGSSSATAAVKKEVVAKAETAIVKTAKSDSSFFSAPKKKSLPSFTKKTLPKKDETVAQPLNIDPFQEAYNAMTGGSVNSNAAAPSASSTNMSTAAGAVDTPMDNMIVDRLKKPSDPSKRKKCVSFPPDAELEAIRWITRAEYPEDDAEPLHSLGDAKALDRGEGRALHSQILQEVIDWYGPPEILLPSHILIEPRGGESVEAGIQAEREKTALIASYMLHSHIPESASDLQPRLGEPLASDTPTVQMLPGADIAEIIVSNDAAAQAPSSLNDLLAQITTPAQPKATTETWSQQLQQPSVVQQSILQSLGLKSPADIAALLSSVSPDALSMLQQQQQQPLVQPSYGGDPNFAESQPAYGPDEQQGYWNDGGPSSSSGQWSGSRDDWDDGGYRGRGRGHGRGRGRGRGRDYGSKKLCNFWAKGYCRFGEACDFWHDPALSSIQTRKR